MKLVIGGYAQGKLTYVREQDRQKIYRVLDGEKLRDMEIPDEAAGTEQASGTDGTGETVILNHFHLWVKDRLETGGDPEREIRQFLDRCPDCVIICDEIGNGIVPADAFERAYRERTGNMLITLAKEAEEVVRVVCGIGQKIK